MSSQEGATFTLSRYWDIVIERMNSPALALPISSWMYLLRRVSPCVGVVIELNLPFRTRPTTLDWLDAKRTESFIRLQRSTLSKVIGVCTRLCIMDIHAKRIHLEQLTNVFLRLCRTKKRKK